MRLALKIGAATAAIALAFPAVAQQQGGTLKLALHPEPPSAVAGMSGLGSAEILFSKIYEALVSFESDLTPKPELAKSWDVSADGLTYTFQLAENVRWHDGEPFDSADVVTSYKVFSKENPNLALLAPRIASVEATGSHEVVFTLNEPTPALIYGLALGNMPIIPDHIYGGEASFRDNPRNDTPIGTGPFKLDQWEKGNFIKLVRNDDYRVEGEPHLNDLYFVIIPDSQGRAVAFEQGSIDVVSASNLELFDVDRLAGLDGVESTNEGWEFFSPHAFAWLNNERPPLDDQNFRQALNYALDKDFIRDVIFSGHATPPKGPIGSRTRFFDPATQDYAFDPDKARDLVAASGYDGREIEMIPAALGSSWTRLAEYQVQAWKDVGINVRLNSMDVGAMLSKLSDRDYDMAQMYMYQRADPAIGVSRLFLSEAATPGSPWNNVAMFQNDEVDGLLHRADSDLDPEKRAEFYSQAQQKIADLAPVVFIEELEFPTLWHARVKDLITDGSGLSGDFSGVWIQN